ncbi:hypothetical protein ACWEKT_31205 [Nocardia takedensis]
MSQTHSLAMHQLISLHRAAAHAAPLSPFNIGEAHRAMQEHMACRANRCPRKAAALDTLAEAGRLVPSTTKPR